MRKLVLLIIILYGPLACSAGNTKCAYPENTVKQNTPPKSDAIAAYTWDSGQDKRSDEYLKTLRILFKNGDHAVIQHKYCSMYNIEVVYFRSSQASYLDEKSLSKIVTELFEQHSALKVKFSTPLVNIISSSLKEGSFDVGKDFSRGFPENRAKYQNSRVEYSIDYKTLDEFNSVYSSATKLYVGIGGEG